MKKSALAKKLGKSRITVRSYLNGHRRIPAEDVLKIERFTNREVSRHELRPDIYPLPEEPG
ncbi:transcriptional regulator [Algicola sagamiensis]|uniref:transcriptional regulator n=1 Tax=Algicola sagamiensis TaxID=163869 RepID=UPI000475A326|nr:YdaS family helix-turn-helix protein [Algicola sagamiensis]